MIAAHTGWRRGGGRAARAPGFANYYSRGSAFILSGQQRRA